MVAVTAEQKQVLELMRAQFGSRGQCSAMSNANHQMARRFFDYADWKERLESTFPGTLFAFREYVDPASNDDRKLRERLCKLMDRDEPLTVDNTLTTRSMQPPTVLASKFLPYQRHHGVIDYTSGNQRVIMTPADTWTIEEKTRADGEDYLIQRHHKSVLVPMAFRELNAGFDAYMNRAAAEAALNPPPAAAADQPPPPGNGGLNL